VKLGEFVKGEKLLDEAIDLHKPSNLNSVERTYINNLSRLGLVYLRTGRDKKAETTYLKALETSRNTFGPKSHLAADTYLSFGLVYLDIGQYIKFSEYANNDLTLSESSQN